jgi:hypothetical protein
LSCYSGRPACDEIPNPVAIQLAVSQHRRQRRVQFSFEPLVFCDAELGYLALDPFALVREQFADVVLVASRGNIAFHGRLVDLDDPRQFKPDLAYEQGR